MSHIQAIREALPEMTERLHPTTVQKVRDALDNIESEEPAATVPAGHSDAAPTMERIAAALERIADAVEPVSKV